MPELKDPLVEDYTLKKESPKTSSDKAQEAEGVPVYLEDIWKDMAQADKDRLMLELKAEFQVLKDQREKGKYEQKWDALDRQYEGVLKEDTRRQFNLNRKITKIKVDKLVNLIDQSFFESDPIFSVSPRPEFAKGVGQEVCDAQQDFLDYKLDNLPFRLPFRLVAHSTTVKGTGWLKIFHDIKRVKRIREERYIGKNIPIILPGGKTSFENKGLKELITNYPDAPKRYPGFCKELLEEKEITLISEYKETIYNDPRMKCVDLKDFYCRVNTDGYEGLKTTRLTVERQNYTYWELKREEQENKFTDIDKLVEDIKDRDKKVKNYETMDFDILECVFFFKLKESDEEETKIVVWVDEKKWIGIGGIRYPFHSIDCYYVPFYIQYIKPGCIYQPGMGEDLTDSNAAESEILNLTLEGAYQNNLITPITDDDDVEAQFLENRFVHGLPIHAKPGSIDFLQKYMKPMDLNGLMNLMQFLKGDEDEVTKLSSGMSGSADPVDPTAPAAKTIALLQQSGIDVKSYINIMCVSFNEIGYILLNMYYQISKEGRKYAINPDRVVGGNPFGVLDRNTMMARTNIQAQAYAFNMDAMNEKQINLSLWQTIRAEMLIVQNPESVYFGLKKLIMSWAPSWKNIVDKLLPPLAQFKQMQAQIALQAVAQYVEGKLQESQVTGVPAQFDARQLLPMIQQLQQDSATQPTNEELKIREQAQQGAQ